jgi:UDP-glucose 4-epimerase
MAGARETWLITGGAGYIGTHVADLFIADGKNVVLLDSLYQGLESRVIHLRKKHTKKFRYTSLISAITPQLKIS